MHTCPRKQSRLLSALVPCDSIRPDILVELELAAVLDEDVASCLFGVHTEPIARHDDTCLHIGSPELSARRQAAAISGGGGVQQ